jgi:hypothetical protein
MLSLSKEEQVRLVISMSDRERDVSQKLIWHQKIGRMVTLVTELVFLGLLSASA